MKTRLEKLLKSHGQEHLLAGWDRLDEAGQRRLADQVEAVDFSLMASLTAARQANHTVDWAELARRAAPPAAVRLNDPAPPFPLAQAKEAGHQAMADGRIGCILVAGGQGTRLGFDHPKGMFSIGPISKAPLFQVLIEKILARSKAAGRPIPLYLMTSPATHDETIAYLAEHDRLGLPEEDLMVFCQGTMPAVDALAGKLLLAEPDRLALSPDGHGGMVAAMQRTGCLDDIERRGIEHLFYFQVDNPLAQVCDPALLGYHVLAGSEYSLQVVAKQTPQDRLGNVVEIDGQMQIIEYSDLPDEAAEQRNDDGSLKIWGGSIAVHVFAAEFLARMAATEDALPFHRARKKVSFVDIEGRIVDPAEPNAIKFERFIFDLLPHAHNAIAIEVDAAEAFSAVKNAPGAATETAVTSQAAILAQAQRWLQAAGARVADGVSVEMSPLYAVDEDQVVRRVASGTEFDEDIYLRPS